MSAIAELLRLPIDDYQVADLAYRIERVEVGIKGGKQDQYATTFGGFNLIEFHPGGTVLVVPLRLRPETIWELEHSLVFAYVGDGHFSDDIIRNQVRNYETRRTESVHAMDRLKVLTQDMKRALLVGDLRELGELLHLAWESKRQMAKGISSPRIDEVYERAIQAGALGGKMSGAGGGGFMFFVCDPMRRYAVQEALRKADSQLVNLTFVEPGVRTWTLQVSHRARDRDDLGRAPAGRDGPPAPGRGRGPRRGDRSPGRWPRAAGCSCAGTAARRPTPSTSRPS